MGLENRKLPTFLRSAITHGRGTIIPSFSLHTALVLSSNLIRKLLTELPYRNFDSKKECDLLTKSFSDIHRLGFKVYRLWDSIVGPKQEQDDRLCVCKLK